MAGAQAEGDRSGALAAGKDSGVPRCQFVGSLRCQKKAQPRSQVHPCRATVEHVIRGVVGASLTVVSEALLYLEQIIRVNSITTTTPDARTGRVPDPIKPIMPWSTVHGKSAERWAIL